MAPSPTLLAFDTCGPYCAAALMRGDDVVVHVEDMARGQGERLMVMLEEVLADQRVTWRDLDAIAVGTGPGNFTGIRIAVSGARGLALGLGVPAIGVSMFDTTQHLANWAPVVVPAPRGEVYFFDPDKMQTPSQTNLDGKQIAVARSDEFDTAAHIRAMAEIAVQRLARGSEIPRPVPMYVRAPDAAPPRTPAPVILP